MIPSLPPSLTWIQEPSFFLPFSSFMIVFIYYTIWLIQLHGKRGLKSYRIFFCITLRKLKYKHLAKNALVPLPVFHMYTTGPVTIYTHIHSKNTISITWKRLNLLKSCPEIWFHWNLNNITSPEWPPSSFYSFNWHLLYLLLALQTECHLRSWYYSQPFDLFPLDHEKCWSESNTEMDCRPSIHAVEQDFRPPLHLCLMLWVQGKWNMAWFCCPVLVYIFFSLPSGCPGEICYWKLLN